MLDMRPWLNKPRGFARRASQVDQKQKIVKCVASDRDFFTLDNSECVLATYKKVVWGHRIVGGQSAKCWIETRPWGVWHFT